MTYTVDRSVITTGPKGEVAHRDLVAHSAMFEPKLHQVTDRVFCAVGYGLANSSLVVGPEGAIVVDTGKNTGEASDHRRQFATVPGGDQVAAVLYSHFHYIDGTTVYAADNPDVEIWGHADIDANVRLFADEVGPRYTLGAFRHFGVLLPPEGPDAMPNHGLGPWLFPPHGTDGVDGYLPPTHTVDGDTEVTIAGVPFGLYPYASDSEDTLIIHLPNDDVVINNHVWPALFNIFTMRGEPYRDPNVHLAALDRILELDPEHLVGVHGTPISGRDAVRHTVTTYRDAIQFIWDQTVRGLNKGLGPDELVAFVGELPKPLADGPFNGQFYGVVPHHVRQVHAGLVGWFGNDCADLFPPEPAEEAARVIAGFGGRDEVVAQARDALQADDVPWVLRLTTWLLHDDPDDGDARQIKIDALRLVAQTTTSSNVRAFCLTQAMELEGVADFAWAQRFTFTRRNIEADPAATVRVLRVLLDPVRAEGTDTAVAFRFDGGRSAGLHVRNGVAAFSDRPPARPDLAFELAVATWADLLTGEVALVDAVDDGSLRITVGSTSDALTLFSLFDDIPKGMQ